MIDELYISKINYQLRNFKKIRSSLFNFSCPICGDSSKKKSKARGYLFRKDSASGYLYKCHNCGFSTTFAYFLKTVDPNVYNEYCMEKWQEKSSKKIPKPLHSFSQPVFTPKRLIDELFDRIDTLPDDHIAVQYLQKRLVPLEKFSRIYFLDDTRKISQLSEKYKDSINSNEPRIVFPFFDRFGKLIGITARLIGNKKSGLRYLTVKVCEGVNVFGLEYLDYNQTIYITEGAVDSLFLKNAVSCSGSSLIQFASTISKQKSIIVWDNEPRNKEICNLMRGAIEKGFQVCIWPENISGKDINDMILKGYTSEFIQQTISENAFSGMEAQFKLNFWRKV